MKLKHLNLSIVAACALSACGGGGSNNTNSGATVTPVLSETQNTFLENTLASNGGGYTVNLGFSASGAIVTLTSAQAGITSLLKSPIDVPGGVTSTATVGIQMVSTVPTPANSLETSPNLGTAFVDAGQVRFVSASAPSKYSFIGNDVLIETAAPGGEVGFKVLVTGYTKVPLTGALSAAPADLINVFRPLASYIKAGTNFLPDAAYYKRVSKRVGDHLVVRDADANPSTNPQSATPVALTGTIEQFAASQPSQLTLALGTIRTVKGARCWINNVSGAPNISSTVVLSNGTVSNFGAYCEVAGAVYSGILYPDGAENGQIYPTGLSSPNPNIDRLKYQVRFNKAAYDSLKAALP